MFELFIVFLVGIFALFAGAALYIWAMRSKGAGVLFAKIFGIVVMILSILPMIGSIFYFTKYSPHEMRPGAINKPNIPRPMGGRLEGHPAPGSGPAMGNPNSNVAPVVVPGGGRSLNRELRRGGVYHKNH